MYVCMYVCMYVYTYIYTYVYVGLHLAAECASAGCARLYTLARTRLIGRADFL